MVTVVATETNVERTIKTDNVGEYVVTELKAGRYTVSIEREGFKKAVEGPFKLDINQVARVDFSLSVGSVHEETEVSAAEPLWAIQVNGLTATNNNFLLNGFDNNEQQIGFEVVQPAIDAIQEFKVQTNNCGADIGRGGAAVNVVLKSGSNQFHGGVYEFVRNAAFDAKNYFDDPTAPIAPFKQNQFGGTFGGPIKKGKTFFFGNRLYWTNRSF